MNMKAFFIVVLCFVFAVQIEGQGYVGRKRKVKPAVGIHGGRHDPLALQGAHRVVEGALNHAAATIDHGSGGAVSMRDPMALQAVEGLARESVHVAGKELGIIPSMRRGVIHPQPIQPVYPKPVMPLHKPVHGIHPKPVLPVHKPKLGMHPRPVHGIHPRPVHGIHPKPVMPIHKPKLGMHPRPVHGIHPKPVMPVHKPKLGIHHRPVHGIHPKPVLPVHKPKLGMHPRPVHGIHPKPVMPVHKPIQPKPIMPVHPKPIHPKPFGPVHHGGMGGGPMMGGDPQWIIDLLSGKNQPILVGGQDDWPRHGGAGPGERFANGLRNNWGADPSLPVVSAVSSWNDPLQGRLFPTDYSGGELVFDDDAGHYVAKTAGHQMAKAVGAAPVHPVGQVVHNVNKGIGGIGGPIGGPIGGHIGGIGGPIGGPIGGHIGGIGGPIGHNIAKSGAHVGISPIGGLGKPLGGGSPVHNVHKVGKSGIVGRHHNPAAANIGHRSATHLAGKASNIVDAATGGGVSFGDPRANFDALNLAREAARVTSEELAVAAGAASGQFIGGQGPLIQPIQPFPTGYGGRKRKVVSARQW